MLIVVLCMTWELFGRFVLTCSFPPVVFIRMKSSYIPFRESKLTKLFQAVFCGKGRGSMIVNINQCASTYDETLHVMKFSAVAKQVSLTTR